MPASTISLPWRALDQRAEAVTKLIEDAGCPEGLSGRVLDVLLEDPPPEPTEAPGDRRAAAREVAAARREGRFAMLREINRRLGVIECWVMEQAPRADFARLLWELLPEVYGEKIGGETAGLGQEPGTRRKVRLLTRRAAKHRKLRQPGDVDRLDEKYSRLTAEQTVADPEGGPPLARASRDGVLLCSRTGAPIDARTGEALPEGPAPIRLEIPDPERGPGAVGQAKNGTGGRRVRYHGEGAA